MTGRREAAWIFGSKKLKRPRARDMVFVDLRDYRRTEQMFLGLPVI